MLVRSQKNEIIDLSLVREYKLDDNVLIILDNERFKKYTLTNESAESLAKYLAEVK